MLPPKRIVVQKVSNFKRTTQCRQNAPGGQPECTGELETFSTPNGKRFGTQVVRDKSLAKRSDWNYDDHTLIRLLKTIFENFKVEDTRSTSRGRGFWILVSLDPL